MPSAGLLLKPKQPSWLVVQMPLVSWKPTKDLRLNNPLVLR